MSTLWKFYCNLWQKYPNTWNYNVNVLLENYYFSSFQVNLQYNFQILLKWKVFLNYKNMI